MAKKSDNTVVVTEPRVDKHKALIVAGIVLVVVAVAAGGWWLATHRKVAPSSYGPQYTGQALVNAVNKKYGTHDYTGAITLLKGQKTINTEATQLLLAAAYANAHDFKTSLTTYQQIDKKFKLNSDQAATAASIAAQAKDYKTAIALFQEAKQRLDASTNSQDQSAVYDYQISELQKKL
ncbi:MAG TPA: hypothetical protein VLG11_03835 [Candidatus Saccharimonadales bacterium]|nr:hypothetical protein [Candidatus Saccharimonadales bacterium]